MKHAYARLLWSHAVTRSNKHDASKLIANRLTRLAKLDITFAPDEEAEEAEEAEEVPELADAVDDADDRIMRHGRGTIMSVAALLMKVLPDGAQYRGALWCPRIRVHAGRVCVRVHVYVCGWVDEWGMNLLNVCFSLTSAQCVDGVCFYCLLFVNIDAGSPHFRTPADVVLHIRRALVDNDMAVPQDELPTFNEQQACLIVHDCSTLILSFAFSTHVYVMAWVAS